MTAAIAAAPSSARRRSPRPSSQAIATGATTSGKPFVITASPSRAKPSLVRARMIATSAATVSAVGVTSK